MQFSRILDKAVPLWLVLLLGLIGGIFALLLAWAAGGDSVGRERAGSFGEFAAKVGSVPEIFLDTMVQLRHEITGDAADMEFRVPQPANADYASLLAIAPDRFPGLLARGSLPEGYLFTTGGFGLAGAGNVPNTALLIRTPEMTPVREWHLLEPKADDIPPADPRRQLVHGADILEDGSVLFVLDGGGSIQRLSPCGRTMWATGAAVHHSVGVDRSDGTVWAPQGTNDEEGIARFRLSDGRLLEVISMAEIIAANPDIDPLGMTRRSPQFAGQNPRNTNDDWFADPFHLNDVEPLPAELAQAFPDFPVGSLLISARSGNLVFVLDPGTRKILWFNAGSVMRQHDPDWLPDGRIMVYNNRMSADFSRIVAIDPETHEVETLFDGSRNDFYSRIRGKAQMLENGALLVTSPQQGQGFAVDRGGRPIFALANTKPGDDRFNYVITEMRWLPRSHFEEEAFSCPTAN